MKGIKIHSLKKIEKSPNLVVGEIEKDYNFIARRFFFINGKKNEIRGSHAHRQQEQFIVCLQGSCQLNFDSGKEKKSLILKENTFGIKVLAGIWSVQKYLEDNTLLLVLSDGPYDEKEYIRDYNEFLQFNKK